MISDANVVEDISRDFNNFFLRLIRSEIKHIFVKFIGFSESNKNGDFYSLRDSIPLITKMKPVEISIISIYDYFHQTHIYTL